MELRNTKMKDYKTYLVNLGLYEEGMKVEEMKQVILALEESQLECETAFFESDLERALKESELDYDQMHCDAHSSTMIKQTTEDHNFNIVKPLMHCPNTPFHCSTNSDASPFSSPEIASEKIVVEAIVHHELNWSPPPLNYEMDEHLQHKRLKDNNTSFNGEKRKVVENECGTLDVKRSRPPITSASRTCRNDSGIHYEYNSENFGEDGEDYQSNPSF